MKTKFTILTLQSKKWLPQATLLLAIISLLLAACKPDPDPDPDPETKKPVIGSVVPNSGYPGDTISIDGENFNEGATNTRVIFNGTAGKIISGTVSTIEVSVPEIAAGSVNVMAIVDGDSTATKTFTVLEPEIPRLPIKLADFTPKSGKYGDEITISGHNFDENVEVYINGKLQTDITYVDSTTLTIRLEKQTGSGKVTLKDAVGNTEETSNDLLDYAFAYTVEDFSNYGGWDILALDDGSCYLTLNNFGLVKLNASGEITDTIIAPKNGSAFPLGLFMAQDGMIYMSDAGGGVLTYNQETKKVDTLISNDPNLPDWTRLITGDNQGNLYVTTGPGFSVVKVDIAAKSTEVICSTASKKVVGICSVGDSLFVTASTGVFKIHKNGGDPEYIVDEKEGYFFSDSDISYHPAGYFLITHVSDGLFSLTLDYKLNVEFTAPISLGISIGKDGNAYMAGNGKSYKVTIE